MTVSYPKAGFSGPAYRKYFFVRKKEERVLRSTHFGTKQNINYPINSII